MPRYKLTIEYDGTPFVGWQIQDNGASVQGVLTDAIAAFAGERAAVHGAGRTDAGVHALGQVAHVDLAKDWDDDTVRDAINFHLRPQPIAVLAAEQVEPTTSTRASRRLSGIISIASSIAAPISRSTLEPRLARAAPARWRRHARGRAKARRPARFHHLPCRRMPGEIAGEDARSPRCQRATATMSASTPRRARSCIIRCARWSARWCTSAKANGAPAISPPRSPPATAPAAARSPRRMGFIWCGWSIDRRAARCRRLRNRINIPSKVRRRRRRPTATQRDEP